jgi:hypothetical protein
MWKTFDWSSIPNYKKHYEAEKSFGVIAFSPDYKKVLVIRSKTKDGVKLGFPQGHANGYESDSLAAARETLEETGIVIPNDAEVLGTVHFNYQVKYTEEILDKHITEMLARGERPYWNKPGLFVKTVKLYVISMKMATPKTEVGTVVQEALWMSTNKALAEMKKTKSNRLPAMLDALKLIE